MKSAVSVYSLNIFRSSFQSIIIKGRAKDHEKLNCGAHLFTLRWKRRNFRIFRRTLGKSQFSFSFVENQFSQKFLHVASLQQINRLIDHYQSAAQQHLPPVITSALCLSNLWSPLHFPLLLRLLVDTQNVIQMH